MRADAHPRILHRVEFPCFAGESNQHEVRMVDGAGDVPRYGNKASLRAEDFENTCGGSQPGCTAPARTQSLGQFKGVTVPH